MKETNGANSFLPWSMQKANTQVWSIQLPYTGFQAFTQNVLSEIIFCKEAKSGAEDTENQCHDTRIQFMLWVFSPCNKMSEMASTIPTLSTRQVIMGWNCVLLPLPDSSCLVPTSLSPHHPYLELEFVLSNHEIFTFSNQN